MNSKLLNDISYIGKCPSEQHKMYYGVIKALVRCLSGINFFMSELGIALYFELNFLRESVWSVPDFIFNVHTHFTPLTLLPPSWL